MLRILIRVLLEFIENLMNDELSLTILTCNWGDNPIPNCDNKDTSIPMAYFLAMTRFIDKPSKISVGHINNININPFYRPFIINDSNYNNLIMFHIVVNRGIINVTMRLGYTIIGGKPTVEIVDIDFFSYGIEKGATKVPDFKISELNEYFDLLSKGLHVLAQKKKEDVLNKF